MKNDAIEAQKPASEEPAKRPYFAPQLRELGDVRELTHGGGSRTSDGFGRKT